MKRLHLFLIAAILFCGNLVTRARFQTHRRGMEALNVEKRTVPKYLFHFFSEATMTKNSSIMGGLRDVCCFNHDKHD